jgi:leucyl-tRNA synthetase
VRCPQCESDAKRETDTMPNWAGSSWYFLRYCDPKNNKEFASEDKLKYFLPVDWYNGGMEHTTLHLLYSRFWHKFLYNQGLVSTKEPYQKRTSHGIVLAVDGRKMSKSFGNVINPDDIVNNEEGGGADTLRLYELFMGPFSEAIPWSMDGVKGVRRFLEKVWSVYHEKEFVECKGRCEGVPDHLPTLLQKTIKKVTEDIESMDFNTAISQMMIFINECYKLNKLPIGAMKIFLLLLSPMAPHIAEELWENMGNKDSILKEKWPEYIEKLLVEEKIKLIVQVNGKVRETLEVEAGLSEEEALKNAKSSEKVKKYIEGKDIKKVIFVPDKILNLVV